MLCDLTNVNRPKKTKNLTLDPEIREILASQKDPENHRFLGIEEIFKVAFDAVRDRDERWYADNMNITDGSESDDVIIVLIQQLIWLPHLQGQV